MSKAPSRKIAQRTVKCITQACADAPARRLAIFRCRCRTHAVSAAAGTRRQCWSRAPIDAAGPGASLRCFRLRRPQVWEWRLQPAHAEEIHDGSFKTGCPLCETASNISFKDSKDWSMRTLKPRETCTNKMRTASINIKAACFLLCCLVQECKYKKTMVTLSIHLLLSATP